MGEPERAGVQHRPFDGQAADRADLAASVGLIAEHGMAERSEMDPGAAFLQKPFTPQTLARKVREVLDAD